LIKKLQPKRLLRLLLKLRLKSLLLKRQKTLNSHCFGAESACP
jgi:hypothetical protein